MGMCVLFVSPCFISCELFKCTLSWTHCLVRKLSADVGWCKCSETSFTFFFFFTLVCIQSVMMRFRSLQIFGDWKTTLWILLLAIIVWSSKSGCHPFSTQTFHTKPSHWCSNTIRWKINYLSEILSSIQIVRWLSSKDRRKQDKMNNKKIKYYYVSLCNMAFQS